VDDLSEVVKSQAFAEDVARLAGIAVPPARSRAQPPLANCIAFYQSPSSGRTSTSS
jgi:hypothetical protein